MNNYRKYILLFYTIDEYGYRGVRFMESKNILDIDKITSAFYDFKDMIGCFNEFYDTNHKFICGKIICGDKEYPLLYKDDLFDRDTVIRRYEQYILENENYFSKTPLIHMNLYKDSFTSFDEYLKRCIFTYFRNNNYLSIRNTYFELRRLGVRDRLNIYNNKSVIKSVDKDNSKYIYYCDSDDYLNELLNRDGDPDWEEINNIYDIEDMELNIKRYRRK